MICVEDFNGSSSTGPVAFWCDWDQDAKLLKFGGMWSHVPDMAAESLPTADQAHEWADKYGGWRAWPGWNETD